MYYFKDISHVAPSLSFLLAPKLFDFYFYIIAVCVCL